MKLAIVVFAVAIGCANADWFGTATGYGCSACEKTLKSIGDVVVESKNTQEYVVNTVYGWCKQATERLGKPASDCDSIVTGANNVVAKFLEIVNPANCKKVDLCNTVSGSLSVNGLNSLVNKIESIVTRPAKRSLDFNSIRDYVCNACVNGVTNIRDALINKLPELVEKLNLCSLLQKPELVADCKKNVPVYSKDLADFITGTASPKDVCTQIHVCQA